MGVLPDLNKKQFTALSLDVGKNYTLVESYKNGQLKDLGEAKVGHLQELASAFSPLGYEAPSCLMLLLDPTDKEVSIFTGDLIEYREAEGGEIYITMTGYNRYFAEISDKEVSVKLFGDLYPVGPDTAPRVETIGPELVKAFLRALN